MLEERFKQRHVRMHQVREWLKGRIVEQAILANVEPFEAVRFVGLRSSDASGFEPVGSKLRTWRTGVEAFTLGSSSADRAGTYS